MFREIEAVEVGQGGGSVWWKSRVVTMIGAPGFRAGQLVSTPAGEGRVVLTVTDLILVMIDGQVHRFPTATVTPAGGLPYA